MSDDINNVQSIEAAMRVCSSVRSASEIASLFTVKASRLIERGSKLNGGTSPDSRWIIDSPLPDNASFEQHLGFFFDLLDGAKVEELTKNCEMDIWWTVSAPGEFSAITLERDLLKRVADKNLGMVFSIYSEESSL